MAKSDVVKAVPQWTDDELAAIDGWDSLATLAKSEGVVIGDTSDYGTGFTVLETKDKATLVGTEFAIVQVDFNDSEVGDSGEFVTLHIVTRDGRKLILNDGSTGIYAQVKSMVKRMPAGTTRVLIKCPKGLTRSDYKYVNDKGEEKPATTYYLSYEK